MRQSEPRGLRIRPFWRVLPARESQALKLEEREIPLLLSEGAGWGTGEHPTTELCLQLIAFLAPNAKSRPKECEQIWTMLDFGSGSGLLSIAGAKLGAKVDAVEIDPEGLRHGRVNAELNGVSEGISESASLANAHKKYDFIVANILSGVLIEFAGELTHRLKEDGILILSGAVSTDVPSLSIRYSQYLPSHSLQIYRSGEWRALVWTPSSKST